MKKYFVSVLLEVYGKGQRFEFIRFEEYGKNKTDALFECLKKLDLFLVQLCLNDNTIVDYKICQYSMRVLNA